MLYCDAVACCHAERRVTVNIHNGLMRRSDLGPDSGGQDEPHRLRT